MAQHTELKERLIPFDTSLRPRLPRVMRSAVTSFPTWAAQCAADRLGERSRNEQRSRAWCLQRSAWAAESMIPAGSLVEICARTVIRHSTPPWDLAASPGVPQQAGRVSVLVSHSL